MASKNEVTEMNRKLVSAGMDFTPVLLDVGDGEIWEFDPDPSPAKFGALQKSLTAFGELGKAAENGEEFSMEDVANGLSLALSNLLVKPGQTKTWKAREYGVMAMQRIAATYIPAISGTPTK